MQNGIVFSPVAEASCRRRPDVCNVVESGKKTGFFPPRHSWKTLRECDAPVVKFSPRIKHFLKTFLLVAAAYGALHADETRVVLPEIIGSDTTLSDVNVWYTADSSITIPSGITLTVNKGVRFRFRDDTAAAIVVLGSLIINGTGQDPVDFNLRNDPANSDTARWGYIFSNYGVLKLNYVRASKAHRFVNALFGTVLISHCCVDSTFATGTQDCIGVHNASDLLVEYCELHGADSVGADCIDCDSIGTGILRYNNICEFSDDGIDIGHDSYDFTIHDNYVYKCANGITIGENSKAIYTRNIVSSCAEAAIEVHTGAYIKAVNNTFYKNRLGVRCSHMGADSSGGSADITNTIIANTVDTLYQVQPLSVLHISYSLSTKDSLPGGTDNLIGDPQLSNPAKGDFKLLSNSPCINKGNPADTAVSCNTRTDIGAIEFDCHGVTPVAAPNARPTNNGVFALSYNPRSRDLAIVNAGHTSDYPCAIRLFSLDGACAKEGIVVAGDAHFSVSDLNTGLYIVEARRAKNASRLFGAKVMVRR